MIPYELQDAAASALERLQRGFRRIWVWSRARVGLPVRRAVTAYQTETARETGVMLGLMADAAAAGPGMTGEQYQMLTDALVGMRLRETVLLGIPNRSKIEEQELWAIRRQMSEIEGRKATPESMGRTPMRMFGPVGAATGLVGALGGVRLWMIFGAAALASTAWAGVQGHRVERLRDDLASTRQEARRANEAAIAWRREFERAHRDVIASQQQAAATARNLEAERRRASAARRRQQERERATAEIIVNDTPPNWDSLLRGDEPADAGAGAGDSGAPVGDSN